MCIGLRHHPERSEGSRTRIAAYKSEILRRFAPLDDARYGSRQMRYTIAKSRIHTRSTKCQYNPSVSMPRWCCGVYLPRNALPVQKAMHTTPQKTWKPWKPVIV